MMNNQKVGHSRRSFHRVMNIHSLDSVLGSLEKRVLEEFMVQRRNSIMDSLEEKELAKSSGGGNVNIGSFEKSVLEKPKPVYPEIIQRGTASMILFLKGWNVDQFCMDDLKQFEKLKSFKTYEKSAARCEICLQEETGDFFECTSCGVKSCWKQLMNYVWNKLVYERVVCFKCIGVSCQKFIHIETLHSVFSHSEEYQKIFEKQFNLNVICAFGRSYPSLVPCVNCDQNYVFISSSPDCDISCKSMDVRCFCGASFCLTCKKFPHPLVPCPIYGNFIGLLGTMMSHLEEKFDILRRREEENMNKNWLHSHNVKKCPNCSEGVEKDEGCKHVTCSRCKKEFCFDCGKLFPIFYNPNHECEKNHLQTVEGGMRQEDLKKIQDSEKVGLWEGAILGGLNERETQIFLNFLRQHSEIDRMITSLIRGRVDMSSGSLSRSSYAMIYNARQVLKNSFILQFYQFHSQDENIGGSSNNTERPIDKKTFFQIPTELGLEKELEDLQNTISSLITALECGIALIERNGHQEKNKVVFMRQGKNIEKCFRKLVKLFDFVNNEMFVERGRVWKPHDIHEYISERPPPVRNQNENFWSEETKMIRDRVIRKLEYRISLRNLPKPIILDFRNYMPDHFFAVYTPNNRYGMENSLLQIQVMEGQMSDRKEEKEVFRNESMMQKAIRASLQEAEKVEVQRTILESLKSLKRKRSIRDDDNDMLDFDNFGPKKKKKKLDTDLSL